jgi:hypothetical protein
MLRANCFALCSLLAPLCPCAFVVHRQLRTAGLIASNKLLTRGVLYAAKRQRL